VTDGTRSEDGTTHHAFRSLFSLDALTLLLERIREQV
jgi:hypothetical protein